MKKKLSILLCVLLVLTMVFAMVPAVSAAESSGGSGSTPAIGTVNNPYILYAGSGYGYGGDTTNKYNGSKAYGCSNSSHTYELKYTAIYANGRTSDLS